MKNTDFCSKVISWHTYIILALAAAVGVPTSRAETIAVTIDTSLGTASLGGNLEFSLGYRFNVDSALTLTELGKFDVDGGGITEDQTVALFNWDTGAKLVEGTILTGTLAEATGTYPSHFVDVADVALSPGTDYLVAAQVRGGDFVFDNTGATQISVFPSGINHVSGYATGVNEYAMPATADDTTFPIANGNDTYYGANFKVAEDLEIPPQVQLEVDRDTGSMMFLHSDGLAFDMLGYSIKSSVGGLNPSQWRSISDNYDMNGPNTADGGAEIGTVDPDDNWTEISASSFDLSEFEFDGGDGATIAVAQTIDLGAGAWTKSPTEDLTMEVKMSDGSSLFPVVNFVGNGGNAFELGDLNTDGQIDELDWPILRDANQADLSGLSPLEAYLMGDLDGDGDNDVNDFGLFRIAYDDELGEGSLDALIGSVPEPSSWLLLLVGCLLGFGRRTDTSSRRARLASTPSLPSRRAKQLYAFAVPEMQHDSQTREIPTMFRIGRQFSFVLAFIGSLFLHVSAARAQAIAVTIDTSTGTPGGNTLAFSLGYRFNVDAETTVTELGKFDVAGDGLEDNAIVALFNWDTGAKITEATILAGTPTEETGSWDTHFVDIVDQVLSPGTDYLLAVEVQGPDFSFDNTGVTTISTFAPGINHVEGLATGVGNPAMPATASATTFPIANGNDTYFGPNFKFAAEPPPKLTLQVDPDTGAMTLVNDPTSSDVAWDINFYQVTSAGNSLDATNWISLADKDFDGNGPPSGSGDGWEESGGIGSHALAEGYLQGDSTLNLSDSISLGLGYDVGVDAKDLAFTYRTDSGSIIEGLVEYVAGPVPDADFNHDGDVNGGDFLRWQRGHGSAGGLGQGDADSNGTVNGLDLDVWEAQYGVAELNASLVGTAVPEPSTLALILVGLVGMLNLAGRRGVRRMEGTASLDPASFGAVAVLIVAWVVLGSTAQAAISNDREFSFGEDALEGASQDAPIGSNNTSPLAAGDTADSIGPTGAFLDLDQTGDPTYQNVGPGGLGRPGVSSTEYGARFDGVDDRLTGIPLNRPDDIDLTLPSYPINYDGITSRGAQLWVYPDAAKIGTAAQTILLDTQIMGGPQISADGKWTQANSGHTTGEAGDVPADVAVLGDTWYHVMHHAYNRDDPKAPVLVSGGGGTNHLSILYVNGVAVSGNGDNLPSGADLTAGGYSGDLVVGAEDDGNGGFTNHFQGVIDNLNMYVFGVNDVGTDYGTFDLFADNDWIAQEIIDTVPNGVLKPGDVNKDGAVNSGDVGSFIAGWGSEHVLVGAHSTLTVGDWNTWDDGDMNHDGVTDLDDAVILHDALVVATGSGLNFDLLFGVPEPTSGLLLVVGTLGLSGIGRSWGRRT